MLERLNKYLAFHLGVSRREADDLIARGRVALDGHTAQLGARVQPDNVVTLDGQPVKPRQAPTYLALHKPAGYVCSRRKQGETPTIYSLLPAEYHRLKPVGRLDADSSGLILLTDDGDFAQVMTHPRHYKIKHYEVSLASDLAPLHQQMISDIGVQLDDGPSRLTLERASDSSRRDWIVTMSEGRNRQIRRTFASLGYHVERLHRTAFGDYALGDMPAGDWTELPPPVQASMQI